METMKNMNICQVSFIIQKSEEEITGSVSSKTMPYNKLLTNLACSSRTGEYWPSVPRPWANIPQYGPRARLVRG